MGCLPNQFPGSVSLTNDEYRARFEKNWNVKSIQYPVIHKHGHLKKWNAVT